MIPLDEYNISKTKTFFIIAWKRSPFWKSDLFKRVVPVWEGEGGLTLNACPDGLGHFFVDVQMGNFLSKGGVRTLARMVCALFRSARTSYRAFDFRPVRPPVRNNFSWVHRWAVTLPLGLRYPSNRIFSESRWCQLSKFGRKYKYKDKYRDKDKYKDRDK